MLVPVLVLVLVLVPFTAFTVGLCVYSFWRRYREMKEAEVHRLKAELIESGEQLLGALQDETSQLQTVQAALNSVRATNAELETVRTDLMCVCSTHSCRCIHAWLCCP